jgi:hypothetical protein
MRWPGPNSEEFDGSLFLGTLKWGFSHVNLVHSTQASTWLSERDSISRFILQNQMDLALQMKLVQQTMIYGTKLVSSSRVNHFRVLTNNTLF